MLLPFVQPTASPLGQMLQEMAQRRQEKSQQAAQNLLAQQRLQLDRERMGNDETRARAQETRAGVAEKREQRFYDQAERRNRLEGVGSLMPYIDPNSPRFDPQMAQQLGAAHGLNVSQAPLPPMPGAAPEEPQPGAGVYGRGMDIAAAAGLYQAPRQPAPNLGQAFVDQEEDGRAGLLMPEGDTLNVPSLGGLRPMQEGEFLPIEGPVQQDPQANMDEASKRQMQQQQDIDAYAQNLHGFEQRQKEHSDQLAAYQQAKRLPTLNVDTGDGQPPMSFDTAAMQRQSQDFRAQRADRVTAAYSSMAPEAQARARQMALQGMDDATIAAKMETAIPRAAALDEKAREFDQSDLTKRYGIDHRPARRGGGPADPRKGYKLDLQLESQLDNITKEVMTELGFKDQAKADRKLSDITAMLAGAKDNAALSAASAGSFVKMAQGGTGVVSDRDMEVFWNRIGGKVSEERVEQEINNLLSGKMGAKRQADAAEGVRQLAAKSRSNLDKIGRAIETRLEPIGRQVPQAEDRIQTYLDIYAGGLKRRSGGSAAAPSNPLMNAAKASKLPPADRKMYDWANAHPDDPRAKEVHDRLGM